VPASTPAVASPTSGQARASSWGCVAN
jgi:hypothetical protein